MQKALDAQDYCQKIIEIQDMRLLKLSKDAKKILFVTTSTGSYQVWSKDLETEKVAQVSHGNDRVQLADIFSDSKRVLFSRDFSGQEQHQFFVTPILGEEEEMQISKLEPVRVADFELSEDGRFFAFAGSNQN